MRERLQGPGVVTWRLLIYGMELFGPGGRLRRGGTFWVRSGRSCRYGEGRDSPSSQSGVQVLQLTAQLLLLLRQGLDVGTQRLHQTGQSFLFLAECSYLALYLC